MLYTIQNSGFLNEFFKATEEYAYALLQQINNTTAKDEINYFNAHYSSKEIGVILILNKAFFQNLTAFFDLVCYRKSIPAFNCLRSAIEAHRLLRAFLMSDSFKNEYMQNENINFAAGPDYKFMQSKVIKELEEVELKLRSRDQIPLSYILLNNHITKDSAATKLHSELSKWSHLLNVNLITLPYIKENTIYLDVTDEYSPYLQKLIKKYTEGAYIMLVHQEGLMLKGLATDEFYEIAENISEMYKKYIEIFY